MEIRRIINVYQFQNNTNQKTFMFSTNKPNDKLSFDYYVMLKNENNEYIIQEATNTIETLQNNNIQLTPIEKKSAAYEHFILTLLEIQNKEKNKTVKTNQIQKK